MAHTPSASLDEYRLLGNSGLRVSPVCLGTMTFGNAWGFGTEDVAEARAIFSAYTRRGGNFVDTANKYQEGAAEVMVGEFMKEAGNRNDLVLATKYSLKASPRDGPNYAGNSRKNFFDSLQESLKRLQTDYVDLFYLHFWDFTTPTDEIMRCFDDAVRRGMIHYAGVSNVPAWRVAEMQTLARERGYPWFIGAQYRYNLADRTAEREVLPLCRAYNIGFIPWGVLGQGKVYLRIPSTCRVHDDARMGKQTTGCQGAGYQHLLEPRVCARLPPEMSDHDFDVVEAVTRVAEETGRSVPQVALNWALSQEGVTSVLLGCRTAAQLESSLEALDFTLSAEHAAALEEASKDQDPGFPHSFIGRDMWSCPWTAPGGKLYRPHDK